MTHNTSMDDIIDFSKKLTQAMQNSKFKSKFNYRDKKEYDWPSYKSSSEKTIKSFKDNYYRFSLVGVNNNNSDFNLSLVSMYPDKQYIISEVIVAMSFVNPDFATRVRDQIKKLVDTNL